MAGRLVSCPGCRLCSSGPRVAECHRDTGVWTRSEARAGPTASCLRPRNQNCVLRRPNIGQEGASPCPPTRHLAPGEGGCACVTVGETRGLAQGSVCVAHPGLERSSRRTHVLGIHTLSSWALGHMASMEVGHRGSNR